MKIAAAEIREVRRNPYAPGVLRPPPKAVIVMFEDGHIETLFTFFPDDGVSFTEEELIGLTKEDGLEFCYQREHACRMS